MAHPVVDQLRFARSEFVRSLNGVGEDEATHRFGEMNCISWMVGHLTDQEQRYWLQRRGEPIVVEGLNALVGYGKPASTPSLTQMWENWKAVTKAVDPFLDTLTSDDLLTFPAKMNPKTGESFGTLMLRVIDHYWFHNGEAQAVRQMLGHTNLPEFVGDIGKKAPYRPETS